MEKKPKEIEVTPEMIEAGGSRDRPGLKGCGDALPRGMTPALADRLEEMICGYIDESNGAGGEMASPYEFGISLFEVISGQVSTGTLAERLDRIHSAFQQCKKLGMQAPSLADLDQIASGAAAPPYND